jgi:signal transduction histidine kinase
VTLDLARVGDGVRLEVRDEGPGLSEEERRHATERFWRGSAHGGGSGLGLSIVDSLAKASGGRLELLAATPQGLAVVVTLPAADGGR